MLTKAPFELEKLSENEYILNMGPQHPSTHGVLRVVLKLEGERVRDVFPDVGYIHSGVEKLCENRTYPAVMPYLDRMDYLGAVNHGWAYALAVEKLAGIQVPERAEYIRVILAELNRIMSHLLWYSAFGLDVGALTPIFYAFRERERVMDLQESVTGARLTHHAFRIGGFLRDLPPGFLKELDSFLSDIDSKIDDYEALLVDNVILTARTKGVGVLPAELALSHGVTGPSLRASGPAYDVRRAVPYSVYPKLDFKVCAAQAGDTWTRVKLRMDEMRESAKIIRQAAAALPAGPVAAPVPRLLKPAPGECYARVESPRGEFGVWLTSDGSEKPARIKFRAPSFSNLGVIRDISVGSNIADIIAIMGSFDLVIPEIDR